MEYTDERAPYHIQRHDRECPNLRQYPTFAAAACAAIRKMDQTTATYAVVDNQGTVYYETPDWRRNCGRT